MNQVGVYKLYKLGRLTGSSFDTSIKVLERGLHPVHHEYAAKINAQSNINGLLYELDEKATKLYWEKKPYDTVKEYANFEDVKEETSDIDALKAEYLELTGAKAHHLWKKEKLEEMIENFKNQNE
jgi:hypothetical protein